MLSLLQHVLVFMITTEPQSISSKLNQNKRYLIKKMFYCQLRCARTSIFILIKDIIIYLTPITFQRLTTNIHLYFYGTFEICSHKSIPADILSNNYIHNKFNN